MSGSLETKYKWAEHGLTFTEKWNTDNTLGTEITLEDQVGGRISFLWTSPGFFCSLEVQFDKAVVMVSSFPPSCSADQGAEADLRFLLLSKHWVRADSGGFAGPPADLY